MPVVVEPDGSIVAAVAGRRADVRDDPRRRGRRRADAAALRQRRPAPQNLADKSGEIAYVVDLDDPAANPVEIAQVSGWEYGVDRLSLATTGLIVGQWNSRPEPRRRAARRARVARGDRRAPTPG